MKSIGKTFIIGDSYSTFRGYIPPEYETYYGPKDDMSKGGIGVVEATWWHQLISALGGVLLYNCSLSGSTVCNTGYGGEHCVDKSFVARIMDKADEFDSEEIDTAFIFGGTNDCWAGSPLGEAKYSDFAVEDLDKFAPAYSWLINYMQRTMPKARIIAVFNSDLPDYIINIMKDSCEHFGIEYLQLHDITKYNNHPTPVGMTEIKDQISELFK